MKLPTDYSNDLLGYESAFGATVDGEPLTSPTTCVYSLVFPPIGFFPFYGIGNGDYHGFYWPIGREEQPPLIAFSSHDVGGLIPEHGNIETLFHCQLARTPAEEEPDGTYAELATQSLGREPARHEVRGLAHDDYEQLLALDPYSPFYLCAAGDAHVANQEIEEAAVSYRQSILALPEYVAAHFGLAYALRRLRRPEEATIHLRETLLGPLAFYGGSFWADTGLPGSFRNDWARKALMWLQRSKAVHESIVDDPFIKNVDRLTYQTGMAENPDIDILQELTDEFASRGQYNDAARVWQLVGDRASCETTSFRQRYRLTPATFGERLAELYNLAGNSRRAALVISMLSLMEKPDGLYL